MISPATAQIGRTGSDVTHFLMEIRLAPLLSSPISSMAVYGMTSTSADGTRARERVSDAEEELT
jgi:hypothetical protein